jgi:capsular polysaccharide transport system permease protein
MLRTSGTPFVRALQRKGHVMAAVMLRDMRTRFFNHGLGFTVVVIWPLAHMFLLLSLYSLMGRSAPYGDSLYLFFATGLVPTLSFMYVSRQMAMSVISNKPMLSFPAIHLNDIILGRATLEMLGSILMAVAVIVILTLLGEDAIPIDVPNAVAALFATLLLALGVGSIVSLLAAAFAPAATMYFLVIIAVYILSGTLFVPSYLPKDVISILSWNPVLHAVEWMRLAYFPDYPRQVLDRQYLLTFSGISLATGLLLERIARVIVLAR